jgi:hypothetical protein
VQFLASSVIDTLIPTSSGQIDKMQGLWRGFGLGFGKIKFVEGDSEVGFEKKDMRSWRMGRDAYEKKMLHHKGIKQLWESKWKFPVSSHWQEDGHSKRIELTGLL